MRGRGHGVEDGGGVGWPRALTAMPDICVLQEIHLPVVDSLVRWFSLPSLVTPVTWMLSLLPRGEPSDLVCVVVDSRTA